MKLQTALATISLALAFNAQALHTQPLKSAKNPTLQTAQKALTAYAKEMNKRYENMGGGTVSAAFRVTDLVAKSGESKADAAERALKAILHRDYPITGDDGGYNFQAVRNLSVSQIGAQLPDSFDGDEDITPLLAALSKASYDKNLVVLVGDGSGNNTMASIAAVLDIQNDEVVYIMDSNFGSDD